MLLLTISAVFLLISIESGEAVSRPYSSLSSPSWRRALLRMQQGVRHDIANNQERGLPPAKQMNRWVWNCEMEYNLEKIREQLTDFTTNITYKNAGVNIAIGDDFYCDATMMSGLTNEWFADDLRPLQSLIYDGNPDTAYFANFAKWNSTEVACTYGVKNNGNDLILICAYNVKGAVIDEAIYEVAKEGQYPCADGARCGTDGTCMDSLCNVPISNPDTLLPIYTPSLYYNSLPFMTQFSRYYAINLHNYYRRIVASGWAENKLTSYTPRAAKMEALMYDSSLEKVASENVKKCDRQSAGSNNDSAITGSNVKIIEVVGISGEAALEQALGEWFNQLRKHGLDPNSMWAEDPNVKQCANIMHDTYKTVGCAVNTCSSEGFTIVECRYGPKRLQEGGSIYDVGVPCSKCAASQKCLFDTLCQ